MWIHVPKTYLASVVESQAWNWGFTQPWMEDLARSVTLRTKSVSPASLRRAWKTAPSIQRLSGLTSAPSTQNLGVERWISSLEASHVSHIPKLGFSSEKTIKGNSAEKSLESPTGLDFQTSFLKTSPAFSGFTGTTYDPNYESWATHLRKDSSRRQKQALLTRENASSSWPTPTALDRPRSPETMAKSAAFRKRNANQNTVPLYLGEVAQNWPTPTTRDYKGFDSPGKENTHQNPEIYLSIHQDQTTTQDGSGSSPDGPNSAPHTAEKDTMCSPKCRRLNQNFVCWLQGLPQGWVNSSAPLATGSFQSWRLRLIDSLRSS